MEKAESIGLAIAAVGHIALFGALSLGIATRDEVSDSPPAITVQISDEIGLESTTPNPAPEAAALQTPELGEIEPGASLPEFVEAAIPDMTPSSAVADTPATTPVRSATKPRTSTRSEDKPKKRSEPKRQAAKTSSSSSSKPRESKKPRTSRLAGDFLEGTTDTQSSTSNSSASNAKAGAKEMAALEREIARKLKPHWTAPTGGDAELLVTKVRWSLAKNGRVSGGMSCSQQGKVTPSNKPQVDLHCERAKAAIMKAQPFSLPEQYYDAWKDIAFNFDRKL